MALTVSELREMLDDLIETHGEEWADNCPVELGYQSNYPLHSTFAGLVVDSPDERAANADPDDDDDAPDFNADDSAIPTAILLVEGTQIGYGSGWWWEAATTSM